MITENDYGHWDVSEVGEFDVAEWFGFIYKINHKGSGKSYIGKKIFNFTRRLKPLKGKLRKRKVVKESDWKEYCSSSEYLKADIEEEGEDAFEFIIIKLCSGKSELSFSEENSQHILNVLTAKLSNGEPAFYNKSIANRHFAGLTKQSEESRLKLMKGTDD